MEYLKNFLEKWGCIGSRKKEIKNVQEWLEKQKKYNTKEKREKVATLNISLKKLEGELDLTDFINLKQLDCQNNKLTFLNVSNCSQLERIDCYDNLLNSVSLPTNSTNLKELNLRNNNFPAQDLSFLVPYTNLEGLYLDNNNFAGSLDYLSGMEKLKYLYVNNTNIDEFKLKEYEWKDIDEQFTLKNRREWEKRGFSKTQVKNLIELGFYFGSGYGEFEKWKERNFDYEQVKEWINVGAKTDDYPFIDWLSNIKKVDANWVLDNKKKFRDWQDRYHYGICNNCQQINTNPGCCRPCQEKEWKKDLGQLTGRELVEKFVQQQQPVLKLIPYEQFTNIEWIGEGGFSKVYRAEWREWWYGWGWNDQKQPKVLSEGNPVVYCGNWNEWEPVYCGWHNRDKTVVLKNLNDSQNITLEFLTEITNTRLVGSLSNHVVGCYGISQDPITKNYMMVLDYKKDNNLRQYLQQKGWQLEFRDKILKLTNIAQGLKIIHANGLMHRDLHPGNILNHDKPFENFYGFYRYTHIADLGLSQPADYQKEEGKIFGVLPYVAPEVLQGKPYTQAADIYSFGIIAYELLANSYPYIDYNLNDMDLVLEVCDKSKPLRPNIEKLKIPQLLKDLIKRCWDTEPEKRPTISELHWIIDDWRSEIWGEKQGTDEFSRQCRIDEYNYFSKNMPYQTHPQAITTSKPINTKEIVQLFQESEKQAFELELKKIEQEINQSLTDEQKELVSNFIQARKSMIKKENYEEEKKKAEALEDRLLDEEDFAEESIKKIIDYCKRLAVEQEKLQTNIEINTNK